MSDQTAIGIACFHERHEACEGKGFDLVTDQLITCECECHNERKIMGKKNDASVWDAPDKAETSDAITTQVEEPIEDRLRRAYLNGYRDGLHRGSWGRFDHS